MLDVGEKEYFSVKFTVTHECALTPLTSTKCTQYFSTETAGAHTTGNTYKVKVGWN